MAESANFKINVLAATQQAEAQLKKLLSQFQGIGYAGKKGEALQKPLDGLIERFQVFQKVVQNTTGVTKSNAMSWQSTLDKFGTEILKIASKIENTKIDFGDLINYNEADYKKLMKKFTEIQEKRDKLFATENLKNQTLFNRPEQALKTGNLNNSVIAAISKQNEPEALNLLDARLQDLEKIRLVEEETLRLQKEKIGALGVLVGQEKTLKETVEAPSINYRLQQRIDLYDEIARKALPPDQIKAEKIDNVKTLNSLVQQRNLKAEETETVNLAKKIESLKKEYQDVAVYKQKLIAYVATLTAEYSKLTPEVDQAGQEVAEFQSKAIMAAATELAKLGDEATQTVPPLKDASAQAGSFIQTINEEASKTALLSNLSSYVTQIFGLVNALQMVRRFVQAAWESIKELDAAFTKIAVVTDMTSTELWKSFGAYNKIAQQLGVRTADAIETSALYYQQGLDTADVMILTTETIKMAQIANMDFAQATSAMTAAVRGFKIEMSEAQRVTDVYSALAAKAAVDTEDLATAISKTASIAGSAGMSLETTSAFLTQIIETTQEAAETAGTAMKTIIARFTELKKSPMELTVEVEGEEVSANKIEKALKIADVALRNTQGEFRDLDDVFLELSKSWDTLSRNEQRYIATTAAGSRQQSRFIAMMDNYERTLELVNIAQGAEGASAIQFAKTLDSVATKIDLVKSSFEGIINNLVENRQVKDFLDLLNVGMQKLLALSEKGPIAFASVIAALGFTIGFFLQKLIGSFSVVLAEWNKVKQKMQEPIKPSIDTSGIGQAQVQQNIAQNVGYIPSSPSVQPKVLSASDAFKGLGKTITGVVTTSIISGITMAAATDNIWIGLASGLSSALVSVLSNDALRKAIGKTAFGQSIAKIIPFLSSIAIPAAVIVGVAALGVALWKAFDPLNKARKNVNKLEQDLQELEKTAQLSKADFLSSKETLKNLNESIDKYEELKQKVVLTKEEQEEINTLSQQLSSDFPELISYYDAAGNAVLKQVDNWNEVIKLQKESTAEAQKKYAQDLINQSILEENLRKAKIIETEIEIKNKKEGIISNFIPDWIGYLPTPITLGAAGIEGSINETYALLLKWGIITNSEIVALEKELELLESQATKTNVELINSFKLVSAGVLDLLAVTNNISLSDTSRQIGQQVISTELGNFYTFVEQYKNALTDEAKDALLNGDLFLGLEGILKVKFKENIELFTSENPDVQKVMFSKVADMIGQAFFESVQDINLDSSQKTLNKLIEESMFMTREQIAIEIKKLYGEEYGQKIIDAIFNLEEFKTGEVAGKTLATLSGLKEQMAKALIKLEGEKSTRSFEQLLGIENFNAFYEEWQYKGEESAKAFLEGLGHLTPGEINNILSISNRKLEENDYYKKGIKLGRAQIDGILKAYGTRAPRVIDFIGSQDSEKVQDILAKGDVSTTAGGIELLTKLQKEGNLTLQEAINILSQYASITLNVSQVNYTSLQSTELLADKYFELKKGSNAATKAIEALQYGVHELTSEGLEELKKEFPELIDDIERFLTSKDIDRVAKFQKAIANAEAARLLKQQIEQVKTQYNSLGKNIDVNSKKYAAVMENIANSLGNIPLNIDAEFFKDVEIADIIKTIATGTVEESEKAFELLKDKILDAELQAMASFGEIKFSAEQLGKIKEEIKFTGRADFTQVIIALATITGSIEEAIGQFEALSGASVKAIETVDRRTYTTDPETGKRTYKTGFKYKVTIPNNIPASTDSNTTTTGSDTDTKEPKKSKVDPYINEKKSIERLEDELENLKIAREESNLNPEEYAANITKTEQLEKERIGTLQAYRERLLSDQAALAAKMESSSYAGAYSINNGVLNTNVAVLQSYIDDNAELADQFSDDWYETVDALESVNDKINEYNYNKDKDPYFNYTQSIENLKGQLEDLKEVRDRTDLTPEERYQNMLEIIAVDKQMVIKLKEYQAKLISDRQNLVASFKAFDNILSISEGQLNKNTALYLKLSPEKRTEIDRLIEKYNELTGFIKENNKQLEREKELLKDLQYEEQEYQAQKIRDALAELEDERSKLDPSEQGENLAKTAVLETELSVLLKVDNENFQKEIDDIKEQLLKEEFKGAVTFTEDGGRKVDYSIFAENNEDDVATLTTLKTLLDELDEAQAKQIANEKEIKNIKSTYSSSNEDQYQKEIEHIEILQQKLSDLENERENGNLTAEDNRNLSETKQTYDELETSIDNYTSSLKQDVSDIERAFAEDFSGAVKVVNGEIEYQDDIFDNLDGTVKDTLNDAIAKWRELNGIVRSNTQEVGANAQEYAKLQAALRQEYVDAYLQTEQKIISILIDRDRDILDAARKNYENMRKIDQSNMEATRKHYEQMKKADQEALDQQRKNYEQLQKTEDEYVESQRERYEELKKADQDYLEALKKNIDDRRKAREKESEYSDLASKEARLMLLKRDSSGAYANEIIELEKEIAETRQDLSDQEVDDLIAALEEQTNGRAENYDRELEALEEEYEKRKELRDAELEALEESYERKQEMLDAELDSLEAAFDAQMEWYDNEIQALEDANQAKLDSMAEYNAEADAIMKMDSESRLEWLKQNDKDFLTATAMAQEKYIRTWTETFAKIDQLMGVYSGQLGAVSSSNAGNQNYGIVSTGTNYTTADQVAAAKNAEGKAFSSVATSQPLHATEMSSRDAVGAMDYYYANVENDPIVTADEKNQLYKIAAAKAAQEDRSGVTGFATGGLVDYTGIAAVHGNPRQPEAFLSATDTKNFSIFADLLREVMGYKGHKGNGSVKASSETNDSTCNIYVTVDSIGSDYDVESAVDKIKKMMVDSASYRSVNLVTRTR